MQREQQQPARPPDEAAPADVPPQSARLGADPARSPSPDFPVARTARGSLVTGTYALLAGGAVLLGAVLLAPAGALTNWSTALAGVAVIGLATTHLTGILPSRAAGLVGLLAGLALGLSGLLVAPIQGPAVGRLLAGALIFLGSAGILAATASGRDRGGQR